MVTALLRNRFNNSTSKNLDFIYAKEPSGVFILWTIIQIEIK
jgi:hypothetical protein